MDQQKIAKAVKDLLIAIGEDPEREGLAETPQRVAKMYQEVFSSLNHQPEEVANYKVFHVDDVPEMVLVQHIPFYSMCEHHCCHSSDTRMWLMFLKIRKLLA